MASLDRRLFPIGQPTRCADCGAELLVVLRRSAYFVRPLCEACYQAETRRSPSDGWLFVLERMAS
jgi:hypothetical protein